MSAEPRFARFRRDASPLPSGVFALPDDGLCLSAFVIVQPQGRPGEILLGKAKDDASWNDVAAMDGERLRSIADRWVLPASQLLFFESPEAAARRIATQQLRRADLPISQPQVFSESYQRGNPSARDPHWDLHFLFRCEWPGGELAPSRGTLWRELAFVKVSATGAGEFGRGHGDILALAGYPPLSS